jgi:nucleoid-associated protein YgaU
MEAWTVLGKVLARQGKLVEARAAFERARALDPQVDGPAAIGLAAVAVAQKAEAEQSREAQNDEVAQQANLALRQRRRGILRSGGSFALGIGALFVGERLFFPGLAGGIDTAVPRITATANPTSAPAAARQVSAATALPALVPTPVSSPAIIPAVAAPPAMSTATPSPAASITATSIPPAITPLSAIPSPAAPPNLRDPVLAALKAQPDLTNLDIGVEQQGTTIRLMGDVPSLAVRYRIEMVVGAVVGVTEVDLSRLRLARTYVVRPGDSLIGIAQAVYGTTEGWERLAQANQIRSPDLIQVGRVLVVPNP